jgi:hypothetical protein
LFPAELAKGATNVIQVAEDCSSLQVGTKLHCRLNRLKPRRLISEGADSRLAWTWH